jgi:hypothetical protein
MNDDFELLDQKLDNLNSQMKINNELNDLSRIENINYAILFSIMAIAITLSLSFNIFGNPYFSWLSLGIIYSSMFLIVYQTIIIYKNNLFYRFLYFNHIIYYAFFILIIPFMSYLLFYIWIETQFNAIVFLLIFIILIISTIGLLRLVIVNYFTVNLFIRFNKRFPILGYKIFSKLLEDNKNDLYS